MSVNLKSRLYFIGLIVCVWAVTLMAVMVGIRTAPVMAQPTTQMGGRYWTAGVDGVGATLTKLTLAPNSASPDPYTERIYITDLVAQSTTGTGGQFILRYGKATELDGTANCGTDTVSLLPSAATAVRLNYPLFSGISNQMTFRTPLVVPVGKDLCVLGVATQLIVLQLIGEVRP